MIFRKREKKESFQKSMDVFDAIKPFTLCRTSKLVSLRELSREIKNKEISGDFVECGTYKGGLRR
jgi:O-methyltransferase